MGVGQLSQAGRPNLDSLNLAPDNPAKQRPCGDMRAITQLKLLEGPFFPTFAKAGLDNVRQGGPFMSGAWGRPLDGSWSWDISVR